MSDFNVILDQFRRLQAQVETHRPNLSSKQREELHKASRNLFYACRGNGEESYPPPMHADAMMKHGVAPAGEWGSDARPGGEVKGPSDVVPALLSPGFSFVPGYNVIGTLTGRSKCSNIKDQSLPRPNLQPTAMDILRRINEGLPPTVIKAEQDCIIGDNAIKKGDELKINNLFAHQIELLEALNKKAEGRVPIGKRGQSLGKSEHVMGRGVIFDECVRQGESRVSRPNVPVPSEEEALKSLANKNEIHAKLYAEMALELMSDTPVIINQEKKDA